MEIYNSNTLVNFSNSILKKYGVKTFHHTIPEVDEKIKDEKKIVVCLFDGMGKNIREMHLKKNSLIRKTCFHTMNSTMPPTTAAATTALLSGKYPIENGWLGWTTYFPELDRNIILFKNEDYNTEEKLRDRKDGNIAFDKFPYDSIFELIKKKNPSLPVFDIKRFPAEVNGPKNYRQAKKVINSSLNNNKEVFMYFYWDQPDATMHLTGIDSKKTHKAVKCVDKFMKKISKKNPDTCFLVISDHGHVNVEYLNIDEHPDLTQTLSKKTTLEKRCISFFVKEECFEQFGLLFNKYYGSEFELLSKQQALNIKLFGEGKPAEGVLDTFGDFIAVSKGKYALYSASEMKKFSFFRGHHAGATKEEREIDVSYIKNTK